MVNAILGQDYNLGARLNAIEAQLRALATQPILLNASTGQDAGAGLATDTAGLHLFDPSGKENVTLSTADGSATFAGNLDVKGTATFEGATTIGGNAAITGTLSLPAGIIGNDALTNPIFPVATHAGANNFGLATGANQQVISTTIIVPTGYSQALVFATATMHAYNNGVTDDAYLAVQINGPGVGASSQTSVQASQGTTIPATGTTLLSGLGGSFKVTASASSGSHAWAASTINFVNLDVMTIFLR